MKYLLLIFLIAILSCTRDYRLQKILHKHSIITLQLDKATLYKNGEKEQDYISKLTFCHIEKGDCITVDRFSEELEKPNVVGQALGVAVTYSALEIAKAKLDLKKENLHPHYKVDKITYYSQKHQVLLVPSGEYYLAKITTENNTILSRGFYKNEASKNVTFKVYDGGVFYLGKISINACKKGVFSEKIYNVKIEEDMADLKILKEKFDFIDESKVEKRLMTAGKELADKKC